MTREEAKQVLGVHRGGREDVDDAFFAEALKLAGTDGELAKWWAAEQALDAAITSKLQSEGVPSGLKDALLSALEPRNTFEWNWPKAIGFAAAAAAIAVALTLGFVHPGEPRDSVADFRSEMVNFVSLDPTLEMETGDLQKIQDRLAASASLVSVHFPAALQKMPALGCRSLLFRGHKVGLVCFRREGNELAHLLVVDRAAFGGAKLPETPDFHKEGDWMTATWAEGDKLYVLASKGGQKELETLLSAIFSAGVVNIS